MAKVIFASGMLAATALAAPNLKKPRNRKALEATHTLERLSLQKRELNAPMSIALAIVATPLLSLCTFFVIKSIEAPSEHLRMSKSFTGLILIPVTIGAIEHVTAASYASREKLEWEWIVQATVTSSIRLALFVLPVTITVAWGLHIDSMTLQFDGFQVVMLFVAIILINLIFSSKKIRW